MGEIGLEFAVERLYGHIAGQSALEMEMEASGRGSLLFPQRRIVFGGPFHRLGPKNLRHDLIEAKEAARLPRIVDDNRDALIVAAELLQNIKDRGALSHKPGGSCVVDDAPA